jgi:hypothetical protein
MRQKLPGRPRPNDDVMREYDTARSNLMRANRDKAPLVGLLYPDVDKLHRWRVQLDCGCIEERLTMSDDPESLASDSGEDPLSRRRLPPGQYLCGGEHRRREPFVQDIVDWGERRVVDFPADPMESDHHEPEVWALIRQLRAIPIRVLESRTYLRTFRRCCGRCRVAARTWTAVPQPRAPNRDACRMARRVSRFL